MTTPVIDLRHLSKSWAFLLVFEGVVFFGMAFAYQCLCSRHPVRSSREQTGAGTENRQVLGSVQKRQNEGDPKYLYGNNLWQFNPPPRLPIVVAEGSHSRRAWEHSERSCQARLFYFARLKNEHMFCFDTHFSLESTHLDSSF